MIRFADWRRPTDDAYAFALRTAGDGFVPAVPPIGVPTPVAAVAAAVFAPGEAERFARRVTRWSGPEDVDADGRQPWVAAQEWFVERAEGPFDAAAIDAVLAGTVAVVRGAGRTDYVMRDHHVLDVVLYHYRTIGALPSACSTPIGTPTGARTATCGPGSPRRPPPGGRCCRASSDPAATPCCAKST